MSQNVQALFGTAVAEGALDAAAAAVLAIPDLGQQIQAGLGISVDDVDKSEVFLVTLLVDDSGSIRQAGNEQVVRNGCNLVRKSLASSKQSDGILICVRYLNGKILMPYTPIDQAFDLDQNNYVAVGSTPLYDQSIVTLGGVVAKAQEFQNGGCSARSATLIICDGAEYGSQRYKKPSDVAKVVNGLSESHIVAFMGIDDGQTDFRKVATSMGIDAKWILTPGNSESEIRKAFAVFSQSAVRASQGANAFSQTAGGGFGA